MALFPVDATDRHMSALQKAKLLDELRHAEFADTWCALPLGILDGKTPDQAAGDPAYRTRLAAAILIIESWQEEMQSEYDFNRLRARLKIPTLGPIDTEGQSIYDIQPMRWHRVRTEKLSDDELFDLYAQARSVHFVRAMQTAGEAILNRPSLAKDDRLGLVFHDLTVTHSPFDESLKYCDQGRRWSDARDEPPVVWDIYEYRIRVSRQEMDEAREPFKRIMDNRDHPAGGRFPGTVDGPDGNDSAIDASGGSAAGRWSGSRYGTASRARGRENLDPRFGRLRRTKGEDLDAGDGLRRGTWDWGLGTGVGGVTEWWGE